MITPGRFAQWTGAANARRPYVVGVPLLRSWETAVRSWAGANGLDNMMLFGTPLDASEALSRSYKQQEILDQSSWRAWRLPSRPPVA